MAREEFDKKMHMLTMELIEKGEMSIGDTLESFCPEGSDDFEFRVIKKEEVRSEFNGTKSENAKSC